MLDIDVVKSNLKYTLIFSFIMAILLCIQFLKPSYSKEIGDLNFENINTNSLIISEFMTNNDSAYTDVNGVIYDWIELYNGTNEDINLINYGLSDKNTGETTWLFPSYIIPSKKYLVVYLTGQQKKGLYANFKLSKYGNENLSLKNANGKVIDAVETIELDKNVSMYRDENGKWQITEEYTPGFSNTIQGREEFLNNIIEEDNSIEITEILPSNKGNLIINNMLYGYIEIKNNTKNNISLNEYFISNDINKPFLYNFPNKVLEPNEIYLIYTSNLNEENHVPFTLKKTNGTVILSKSNRVVQKVDYTDLSNGLAYIKENGIFVKKTIISPGYENTEDGMSEYLIKNDTLPKGLIINEVMNSNNSYLVQNGGKYYDWIEIYNNTDERIDLSEYYLSNDYDNKKMYHLPKIRLRSKRYAIIMASGDTSLSNSEYNHANFKLSSLESLYLFKDDVLIDSMVIYNVPDGYSYGRGTEYGHYYFENPSPKYSNDKNGIKDIVYTPDFSINSGLYNNTNSLELILNSSGDIYYTLDGSIPNNNSNKYQSPILLNDSAVVKAISYQKDKSSEIVTNTYIINENHSVPIISISIANDDFEKLNNSTYETNSYNAYVEYISENGKEFSSNCGIQLFGGESRELLKKSFQLKFTANYNASTLKYRVFDNRDAVEYKSLVLRSGSQDMNGTLFKDELITSIINYGDVDVQANRPVVLYVNGKYHGFYFLREKINEEFIKHHYNLTSGIVNMINMDNIVDSGSGDFYYNLLRYASNNDLSISSNYEYIKNILDIQNFIDLWISEAYSGNYDVHNIRFFNHSDIDNGRVKLIAYDFDYAFSSYYGDYFQYMTNPGGMGYYKVDNTLMRALMHNNEFRNLFIERIKYNLVFIWNKENIDYEYNKFYNIVKNEVRKDHNKWNFNYDNWVINAKNAKIFLENRRPIFLNYVKNYFNLTDKEMNYYFE